MMNLKNEDVVRMVNEKFMAKDKVAKFVETFDCMPINSLASWNKMGLKVKDGEHSIARRTLKSAPNAEGVYEERWHKFFRADQLELGKKFVVAGAAEKLDAMLKMLADLGCTADELPKEKPVFKNKAIAEAAPVAAAEPMGDELVAALLMRIEELETALADSKPAKKKAAKRTKKASK